MRPVFPRSSGPESGSSPRSAFSSWHCGCTWPRATASSTRKKICRSSRQQEPELLEAKADRIHTIYKIKERPPLRPVNHVNPVNFLPTPVEFSNSMGRLITDLHRQFSQLHQESRALSLAIPPELPHYPPPSV